MLKLVLACVVVAANAFTQDPCSNCNEMTNIHYQRCAMEHGDPCAELNADGLVSKKPGKKKDVGCCMKKNKHENCLKCAVKDCEHGTCTVNKLYGRKRAHAVKKEDKDWDKKAMKESGWGGF